MQTFEIQYVTNYTFQRKIREEKHGNFYPSFLILHSTLKSQTGFLTLPLRPCHSITVSQFFGEVGKNTKQENYIIYIYYIKYFNIFFSSLTAADVVCP